MHILLLGYGQTAQRLAQTLSQSDHQITTISRSAKDTAFSNHLIQDVAHLDLSQLAAIDQVYVLLAPAQRSVADYRKTYLDSVAPICRALASHPVQRIVVVSSTRVYGEHQGEQIDDSTPASTTDPYGQILLDMEHAWRQAYPTQCVILRPSGIYGRSVQRLTELALKTTQYRALHWSNRIHIDDLAAFLAHLLHVEQPSAYYLVSDSRPIAMHEILTWFRTQLGLPPFSYAPELTSGKRIFAQRMLDHGFCLQHPDCFQVYRQLAAESASVR
ncbi:NAD-dependent epimerase/dehydratase family protein [Acinetobacter larvae]|uniref:NAD(P)-dependent oxidoreductase n=1 Tax=Acinetobacter larvae TaxID=1789224 RepID=A0A1B2LWB8_9GAMM|nr:NAD-dependent epimerase/dehydratase family protein [Acinetobacter larvae]AOA57246.1 NAD(P)-dependent oxidoreductase [Acinetobacter larvae]